MGDCGKIYHIVVKKGAKEVLHMFMGEYNHTIDAKGRLIIPAKIREQLGEHCVLTKGLDNCITIYTESSWIELSKALQSLSTNKANARAVKRFYFGSAAELEFDKQGRILVPNPLREHAELQKDVVIIGTGDHVEIWSRHRYDNYNDEVSDSIESLAEGLEGITL